LWFLVIQLEAVNVVITYNSNSHDNVYDAVIMAQPLKEFIRFMW